MHYCIFVSDSSSGSRTRVQWILQLLSCSACMAHQRCTSQSGLSCNARFSVAAVCKAGINCQQWQWVSIHWLSPENISEETLVKNFLEIT
jgi:hypothetical protein